MNYIWDIALRAKASGIDRGDLFFEQSKSVSPFYEQSFSCLNQSEIEGFNIEINALYRFSAIFTALLHPETKLPDTLRSYLFDLAVHILCEMDLHSGLTKHEFYTRRLAGEISGGLLGQYEAKCFLSFSTKQKSQMASLVLCQLKAGSSLLLFRKAILAIWQDAILYQAKDCPEKIMLYLGRDITKTRERRMQFILDTFLPIYYQAKIFWSRHFGVIGVCPTMRMNEIEICL